MQFQYGRLDSRLLTYTNRNAFLKDVIALPDGTFVSAANCVYHAPRGFRAKPSLLAIYGNELTNLFHRILGIKFASDTEVLEYLQQIRSDASSTMQVVSSVYQYLERFCQAT